MLQWSRAVILYSFYMRDKPFDSVSTQSRDDEESLINTQKRVHTHGSVCACVCQQIGCITNLLNPW